MRREPVSLGELTEIVQLVSNTPTADGAGGYTEAESIYGADVWAHVRPIKGSESQKTERQEAEADYLVVLRYRTDVVEGHVVRWSGRDLNVSFVRNRGVRQHFLEIECVLGKAI